MLNTLDPTTVISRRSYLEDLVRWRLHGTSRFPILAFHQPAYFCEIMLLFKLIDPKIMNRNNVNMKGTAITCWYFRFLQM